MFLKNGNKKLKKVEDNLKQHFGLIFFWLKVKQEKFMLNSFLKKANLVITERHSDQSRGYADNSGNSCVLHILIVNKNLTMSFSTCNHWSLFYAVCPLWEAGWSVVMLQLIPYAATSAESQASGAFWSRKTFLKGLWEERALPQGRGSSAAPSFGSSVVQNLSLAVSAGFGSRASVPKSSVLLLLADSSQTCSPGAGPPTQVTPPGTLVPAQSSPPCWHMANPPTAAHPEPAFRRQRFLMDSLIVCFQNTVTSMWKIGSNWLASYENKFQCLETEHNFKCYHPTNHVLPLLVFHFSGMNLGQFCICPIYFIYTCSLYLHTQMGDTCLFSFGQAIVLLKWKCAGFGIQLQHMFKNER